MFLGIACFGTAICLTTLTPSEVYYSSIDEALNNCNLMENEEILEIIHVNTDQIVITHDTEHQFQRYFVLFEKQGCYTLQQHSSFCNSTSWSASVTRKDAWRVDFTVFHQDGIPKCVYKIFLNSKTKI